MSTASSKPGSWSTAALIAGALVMVGPVPPAAAHTTLVSSNPTADSTLAAPPTTVELVFAGPVRSPDPVVALTIDGWEPVEVPAVIDGTTVTAQLDGILVPGLTEASYPASWRLGFRFTAADGDPFSGLLDFTVATGPPGSPTAAPGTAAIESPARAGVAAGDGRAGAPRDATLPAAAAADAAVGAAAAVGAIVAVRRRRETDT